MSTRPEASEATAPLLAGPIAAPTDVEQQIISHLSSLLELFFRLGPCGPAAINSGESQFHGQRA